MTVTLRTSVGPTEAIREHLRRHVDQLGADIRAEIYVDVDQMGLRDRLADMARHPAAQAPAITLPIRWYARTVLVGPVAPAAGPCVRCLERRWQELRPTEERAALERRPDADGAAPGHRTPGSTPGQRSTPGRRAAVLPPVLDRILQAARTLLAEPPGGTGTAPVYEIALDSAVVRRHTLIADSLCPRCATPAVDTAEMAVPMLAVRHKPEPFAYRLRAIDDYPLAGYMSPVCGTIGNTALRMYRFGVTAPVSGLFRVRSKYDLHEMWWSGHADSFADSERLGVLEGLERYVGQQPRGRLPAVHDSFANLAPKALDPRDCGSYRPGYYLDAHHYQPFSDDLVMPWMWGYSLRDKRPVLVPEQLAYYLDCDPAQSRFVQECSNGCASGSCLEEAMLHGLLELIERDSFLLSWYSARTLPEIDIRSVRDPQVHFMRERLALMGYDVRLFDMRVDMPVPVVMAIGVRRDGGPGTLCFAAGSGFDPHQAVRAALCETASYVPGFSARVTDRIDDLQVMVRDYEAVRELSHHALLYGMPEMAPHAAFLFDKPSLHTVDELYADWLAVRPVTDDLTIDLSYLADLVADRGSDVVVVDQTAPEQSVAGTHTAAMIAPGLVPIDFGWARQRVLHHPRFTTMLARTDGRVHPHPHPFP